MSNRQSRMMGGKFEPVPEHINVAPGEWILAFGVLTPAAAIALELLPRICAQAFFDPLPTYWHALAVAMVPAGNLLVWINLQNGRGGFFKVLGFAHGGA